ncbi:hypothetical protein SCHPADRAFT_931764, partial [Schizopora paradoxa]
MDLEEENTRTKPLSTQDRFFLDFLACYDIRRHLSSLLRICQEHYPGILINELRFCVYYDALVGPVGLSIKTLSEDSPEYLLRVAQQTKDQDLGLGPPLVEVFYFGGESHRVRSFHFLLPREYFTVPKLLNQYQEISDSLRVSFRSQARYWFHPDGGESDFEDLSSDIDEVGAVLSLLKLSKGNMEDPSIFPFNFRYS